MNNLAIIPARGGSKRIPKKNIKLFLGKPIIAYTIEVALNSGLFDEVMVSTDDREIAIIAEDYGAKVPFFRSDKTSDDFATTADVLSEVIMQYDTIGIHFQNICCIYPTAPLINSNQLRDGFELLEKRNFDSILPVVPYSYPIWRSIHIDKLGNATYIWPKYAISRSQDLETAFHDAGQWYWIKIDQFIRTKSIIMNKTGTIKLTDLDVQDIDTITDWKLAELKYKLKYNNYEI